MSKDNKLIYRLRDNGSIVYDVGLIVDDEKARYNIIIVSFVSNKTKMHTSDNNIGERSIRVVLCEKRNNATSFFSIVALRIHQSDVFNMNMRVYAENTLLVKAITKIYNLVTFFMRFAADPVLPSSYSSNNILF